MTTTNNIKLRTHSEIMADFAKEQERLRKAEKICIILAITHFITGITILITAFALGWA